MIIVVKGPSSTKKNQFAVELSKLLNGRYISFNNWNNVSDIANNYKTTGILVLDEEYPNIKKFLQIFLYLYYQIKTMKYQVMLITLG